MVLIVDIIVKAIQDNLQLKELMLSNNPDIKYDKKSEFINMNFRLLFKIHMNVKLITYNDNS